ncbi:MAG TPA: hypothetical protein VJ023_16320 [Pyrinomonadaceae bacterium]|nr:hypothetical protein [Pyrinomonadaceae bacterium]
MNRTLHWLVQPLLLFALGTVFTLGMIYTRVVPLGAVPYSIGIKGQDCGQMIWNLWFVTESISHGQNPYHTKILFHPEGADLGHHTLVPGVFPVTVLLKLLTGNDPLYPFYAYRIIILLSFTLLLLFAFLLFKELGFGWMVAATFAVGYAFSDFYMLHFIHLNHAAGFFMPLAALLLVRSYKSPKSNYIVLLALTVAVAVYFTEFTLYIYMAAAMMAAGLALFPAERREVLSRFGRVGKTRMLIASSLFLLILAPVLFIFFSEEVRNPPLDEISHYSANLAGFFIPGQERDQPELYGEPYATPLYGQLFSRLDARVTVGHGGYEAFVGFPLLLLSGIAVFTTRNKYVFACLITAIVFFILSLGPTLKIFGTDTGIPMPYAAIMNVPPFDAGRTPIRFNAMSSMLLAVVGATGLATLARFVKEKRGANIATVVTLLFLVWTTAEAYSPIPQEKPFQVPESLFQLVEGPVLNVPPVMWDGYAVMLQTLHHKPIDTGYLARNNETQYQRFQHLRKVFDKGGQTFCDFAVKEGFKNVLIRPTSVLLPHRYSMVPLDLEHCPIKVVDLRYLDRDVAGTNPDSRPAGPKYEWGHQIDFGNPEADKYFWYGWSGREAHSRWTDRGTATLIFSIPDFRAAKLQIKLTAFIAPPRLNSQRLLISLNGYDLAKFTFKDQTSTTYEVDVPVGFLLADNVLKFAMPDAEYPRELGVSLDTRLLGINVQSIRLIPVDSPRTKN